MDLLLQRLRDLYLGCDIEVNSYPSRQPLMDITSKGPIESIDRGPDGTVIVTVKWWGEKDLRQPPVEYVARAPRPIVVKIKEDFRPDGLGRLVLFRMNNEVMEEAIVFFGKQRGNMDPRKVRGIDPKFLPN